MEANETSSYVSCNHVAVEKFENGVLLFNADSQLIYALDHLAYELYLSIVKNKVLNRIAIEYSGKYDVSYEEILNDLIEFARDWESKGFIKRVIKLTEIEDRTMSEKKFKGDPNISCREEPPEGAILYNPEKDIFHVLNQTGLAIWQIIITPKTITEIVYEMTRLFEDIPVEQVASDVQDYLDTLLKSEFVVEFSE